jgi:proton glutamate symport protein
MKKLALHWQILIAFILAVILGVLFPSSYVVQLSDYEQSNLLSKTINKLESVNGNTYLSNNALFEDLEQLDIPLSEAEIIAEQSYESKVVGKISWLGDLFLKLLKMIIVPLILTSIISGISSLGSSGNLGRLGFKTLAYYVTTSILAITTGLFMVNIFKPGVGANLNMGSYKNPASGELSFLDIILDIVPENIFEAFQSGKMISIIFFALLFGFFITKVSLKYKKLLTDFFQAAFEVMMKITMFIIRFAPIGILGIVAKIVSDQPNLGELVQSMGKYMLVVIGGLSIHAFISLPILLRVLGKAKPFLHFKNMGAALLTAFSTSSSSATLPLTMNAVENNSGVSNKISSFTLPLGATVNMDGTALYEVVVAMFIAQVLGYDITIGQQILAVFTALLASIGAAGIPMAGLVMITVVLSALGLPLDAIGLVLAVDRILDMFRTAVNVWSDSCGAVIIAKSEKEQLKV